MLNPHGGAPIGYGMPEMPYSPVIRRGQVLYLQGLPKTYTSDDLYNEYKVFGQIVHANTINGEGEICFTSIRAAAVAEEVALQSYAPVVEQNPYIRNSYMPPVTNALQQEEFQILDMQNISISCRDDGTRHLHTRANMQRMIPGSISPAPRVDNDMLLHAGLSNRFTRLPTEMGKCLECGEETSYTCMRCGKFFCSRDCQAKSWPTHKLVCEIQMPPLNFSGPKFRKDFNEYVVGPDQEAPTTLQSPPRHSVNMRSEPQSPQSGSKGGNSRPSEFAVKTQTSPRGDNFRHAGKPGLLGDSPGQHHSGSSELSPSFARQSNSYEKPRSDNSRFQSGSRVDGSKHFGNERNNRYDDSFNKRQSGPGEDRPKQFVPRHDSGTIDRPPRKDGSNYERPRQEGRTYDRSRQDGSTYERRQDRQDNRFQSESGDGPRQFAQDKPRYDNSSANKYQSGPKGDSPSQYNKGVRPHEESRRDGVNGIQDGNYSQHTPQNASVVQQNSDDTSKLNISKHVDDKACSASQPSVVDNPAPAADLKKTSETVVSQNSCSTRIEEPRQSNGIPTSQTSVETCVTKETAVKSDSHSVSNGKVPACSSFKTFKDTKTVQLKSGSHVVISCFKGPQLYVRPAEEADILTYCKFNRDLAQYCVTAPPLSRNPKKKEFLICKYSADGVFYRAIVEDRVSVPDSSSFKYTVRFVDYGNKEEAVPDDMRPIPDNLAEIPIQAVKTHLRDVETVPFNEEANKILQELFDNETPVTVMFDGPDGHLSVDLKTDDGLSLNQKIRQLMHLDAEQESNPPDLGSAQDQGTVQDQVTVQDQGTAQDQEVTIFHDNMSSVEFPPVGSNTRVLISHIHPNGVLMCSPVDNMDLDALNVLSAKLNEYGKNTHTPHRPAFGEIIVAKWNDGLWYRALNGTEVVTESTRSFDVVFIDHGNNDIVAIENIRKLKTEFAALPTQSIPCYVDGLNVTADSIAKLETEQKKHDGCWVVDGVVKDNTDGVVLKIPALLQLM